MLAPSSVGNPGSVTVVVVAIVHLYREPCHAHWVRRPRPPSVWWVCPGTRWGNPWIPWSRPGSVAAMLISSRGSTAPSPRESPAQSEACSLKQTSYLVDVDVITVRNEVAKVMFLDLSVILFTGGGFASVHAGISPPPPRKEVPPQEGSTPREGSTPSLEGSTPPGRKHPPETAAAADSKHPTGMHSCS